MRSSVDTNDLWQYAFMSSVPQSMDEEWIHGLKFRPQLQIVGHIIDIILGINGAYAISIKIS